MTGFLKFMAHVLASPLLLATTLLLAAMLARLLRRPWLMRICMGCALLAGWLGSTAIVSHALIETLERQYARIDPAPDSGITEIVVLGSGFEPAPGLGSADSLDSDGLRRILEGLRLASRLHAHLVLSGGARDPSRAPALGYERFVLERSGGTCDCRLLVEALDTAGEARALRSVLSNQSFLLVTSAYHMPRAMRLMQQSGLHPQPAPTGFSGISPRASSIYAWLPSSEGARLTERAMHEYFGLAAIELLPTRASRP